MKKYIVFCWNYGDALGGMNDFKGFFSSIDEAVDYAEKGDWNYSQVYDREDFTRVI